MEIIIRKISRQGFQYKDVTIKTDTTEVHIGLFDGPEAAKLAYKFEEAADELVE